MKKLCWLIIVSLILIPSSLAQTNIPAGQVSGTWTLANSPYYVGGEITVPDGETLTIEPGVAVVFTGNYKFNIQGRLLAIGTIRDTITFTAQDTSNGWHGLRFVKTPSTNDTSKIVYCRLQYGQATFGGSGDQNGGAIYIDSFDKMVISNCLITKNQTAGDLYSGGGGIGMVASSPRIENNMISYNTASGGHGGGIYVYTGSNPYIKNNIITKNHATGGGALVVFQGNPVFINNTITQNVADSPGGATCHGGAMCIVACSPLFFNTILYGNKATIGNQAHLQSGAQPAFCFCTIEGGRNDFARDLSPGGSYSGTYVSNIETDPLFISTASDNYHLSDHSPCIGAGGDSITVRNKWYYAPRYDYEGNPRPNPINSTPDIGALENSLGNPLTGWIQTKGPEGGTVTVSTIAVSGTNLFAGTSGSGVFLSTNNGTSWTAVNTGLTNTYVYALAASGINLFAGTDGGVFLSSNNGTSWTAVNTGLTNTNVFALAISGSNFFAGTNGGGVFLSSNNGTSWTAVNTGLTNTIVLALAVSGSNLFSGTAGGGVFLSTNNGTSWTAVNTGLTSANVWVWALAVSGSNLFAGASGSGVFLSTNNGTSWTAANTGLSNTYVNALAASGSNLFAGTLGGVFLSSNNGMSWTAVNTGLTNTNVSALAVSGSTLFAGTTGGVTGGVWRRPLSEITSVEKLSTNLPTGFILRQNYPNPFNPTTTIQYSVPSSQYVSLEIYDVLGREAALLVGEIEQPGTYAVMWDASGLSSGVYFYRLKAGKYVETKKMILLH